MILLENTFIFRLFGGYKMALSDIINAALEKQVNNIFSDILNNEALSNRKDELVVKLNSYLESLTPKSNLEAGIANLIETLQNELCGLIKEGAKNVIFSHWALSWTQFTGVPIMNFIIDTNITNQINEASVKSWTFKLLFIFNYKFDVFTYSL